MDAQPTASTNHSEVFSGRHESVVQDVLPIDSNDQVRDDNASANDDGDASLAPIPSIQAPETVAVRYDLSFIHN